MPFRAFTISCSCMEFNESPRIESTFEIAEERALTVFDRILSSASEPWQPAHEVWYNCTPAALGPGGGGVGLGGGAVGLGGLTAGAARITWVIETGPKTTALSLTVSCTCNVPLWVHFRG